MGDSDNLELDTTKEDELNSEEESDWLPALLHPVSTVNNTNEF